MYIWAMKTKGCLFTLLLICVVSAALFLHFKNNETSEEQSDKVSGARLPARTLEKMVNPMIDSFIKSGTNEIAKDSVKKTTVLVPKTTVYGLRILSCRKTEEGVRCIFQSTTRFREYGIVRGSLNIKGSPVKWSGNDGFWAQINGKAGLGGESDSLSAKNVKEIASQVRELLPKSGVITPPEDKCIKRALGFTAAGDVFIVESEELLTLAEMSASLLDAGACYAIFLPGHLAYNCVIGASGLGANFASYTKERPEGLSTDLW